MKEENQTVRSMLGEFERLIGDLGHDYDSEVLADHVVILRPKGYGRDHGDRDVPLTFLGLVHGNEVGGLSVLCAFLDLVVKKAVTLDFPVGVVLGNVPAALQGRRFLDRDLNRSFGREGASTREDVRARQLEPLLKRTGVLIDFHQVRLACDRAFWIFPYTRRAFALARGLAPDVSVITHWGKPFSQDGMGSEAFVNMCGGYGGSLELGQAGFDPRQIGLGVEVCLNALAWTRAERRGEKFKVRQVAAPGELFTLAQTIDYPKTGAPVLDLGWHNFAPVKSGQRLGEFQGKVISAEVDGLVLFPKYPETVQEKYGTDPPAAELVRILKVIRESDLPH